MNKIIILSLLFTISFCIHAMEDKRVKIAEEYVNKVVSMIENTELESEIDLVLSKISEQNGEFSSDFYSIFIIDFNGLTFANSTFPEFIGKNFLFLKDPNGIEFVQLYVSIAKEYSIGWCEYTFLLADKVSTGVKRAYISKLPVKIDGNEVFVGCSFEK